MESNQRLADGKAKAQPGPSGRILCGLLEWIKNAAELVSFNPGASVIYFDAQPSVGIRGPHDDLAFIGGEFYGIVQQVPENLTQARRICLKPGVFRFDLVDQSGHALSGVRKANTYRVSQNLVGIDRFFLQRQLSAANARQIEKVIDQPSFDVNIAADRRGRFSNVRWTI